MKLAHILLVGPDARRSDSDPNRPQGDEPMTLGNFSVSLAVRDINASKAFYEKLGFTQIARRPRPALGDHAERHAPISACSRACSSATR